jgi:hypothetical protein
MKKTATTAGSGHLSKVDPTLSAINHRGWLQQLRRLQTKAMSNG